MCIGEFVKYKFSINKSGNARCKSDAGSCERALCECDRQFAIDHAAATGVYTDDFHAFWAPNGWDPEGQCMKGGNGQNDPQCCGGNNAPYVSNNFQTQKCFYATTCTKQISDPLQCKQEILLRRRISPTIWNVLKCV